MSDEKKPFAQSHADAVVLAGVQLLAPGHEDALVASYADSINAAVDHERREAAVKALNEAAEQIEPSEIKSGPGGQPGFIQGKEHGLSLAANYLRARAQEIKGGAS